MLALNGIYNKGHISLDERVATKSPVKVIVIFMDDDVILLKKPINVNSLSFLQCRELLKDVKGNLSGEVIAERRG